MKIGLFDGFYINEKSEKVEFKDIKGLVET